MLRKLSLLLLALMTLGGLAHAQRSPQELYEGRSPRPNSRPIWTG